MKIYILMVILAFSLNTSMSFAQSVGSAFSYQGELIDGGSPANGDYNFTVKLYTSETGGTAITDEVYNDVSVENGLFNLEIDFGDMVYEDSDQYYLEFDVSLTGGSSTTLTPRSKLLAVPYAVQSQFTDEGTSPWNEDGITLTSPGRVGVGEPTPSAQLHVTNNQSQISLLKVDDVSDTRMVIQATGKTGVGTNSPSDRLHIRSEVGEDALRVQVDSATKLRVLSNGGTSLGSNNLNPPENGLFVAGDVIQSEDSNGMLKYMLRASCSGSPTIVREYNGTNVAGSASITGNTGQCTIIFPFNVTTSFISATPIQVNSTNRTINCANLLNGVICELTVASTGADVDGTFDLLVF